MGQHGDAEAEVTVTVDDPDTARVTVEANLLPGFVVPVAPAQYPLNRTVKQTLPASTNLDNRDLTFVVEPAQPVGLRYVPPMKVGEVYVTGGQVVGPPTAQRRYRLPFALRTGGDASMRYTLTPALPGGLTYTPPTGEERSGGALNGLLTETQEKTPYTLTATDRDGDTASLPFTIEVVRIPVRVTLTAATVAEDRSVEFAVTLSRTVSMPITLY